MHNLPFSPEKPLFETIKRKYLFDVLRWLGDFHDSNSKTFLGAKTGSTWGVGFSLICLFNAKPMYVESELFPGDFDEKASKSVQFLLEKATFGSETCSWDSNIWDTAVITRALILYSKEYESDKSLQQTKIYDKSLKWLGIQVANWNDLRYTLGLAELAQVLQTFIVAQENISDIFRHVVIEIQKEEKQNVLGSLVEEMIHSAKIIELNVDGKSEQVAVWDDGVFGTSEAIISLSLYVSSNAIDVKPDAQKEILELIGQGLRYIELKQRDGRWGIEEETAMALRAYILGHNAWGKRIEPEPHLIFKALRYLCDEKTVFSDGSIAHEMEPTIYYALALIEALRGWSVPDELCENKPVIELYDFILWNTPARSTYERLLRTKAEAEASVLRGLNANLALRISIINKQLSFWQGALFIIVWLSLLVFFVALSNSVSPTMISIPVGLKITDWEIFIALTGAWATLGAAAYRIFLNRKSVKKE